MSSYPTGYSGATAIAQVQARTNETSLPSTSTILSFLNAGVEQVVQAIGGVKRWKPYPTQPNQVVISLDNDIQDIISCSFSTGDPTQPGALVYPMFQMEQGQFMDFAAGFPAVGYGPPAYYFVTQDFGTGPAGNLPPPGTSILTATSGASTGGTLYVVETYVNPSGETLPGDQNYQGITTSEQVLVGSPEVFANVTGYNVYASWTDGGPYQKQNSSPILIGNTYTIPGTLNSLGTPPTSSTASYPSGGFITIQVYPSAMLGQVNVYFHARSLLWADATTGSYTNLDTMAQEAVILWTCCRVLENRQRGDEALQIFQPQFQAKIEELKLAMQRRQAPKSSTVRNVRDLSLPAGAPFWYGS